ncbi:MAG: PaaI family thioesterase [Smithellaceae bacterium]
MTGKREGRPIFNYPLYLESLRKGTKGLNPYLDHFNISVTQLGDGRVVFKMPVRPEYLQGAKAMQGGLIVSLADEAIAHAMMTQLSPDEGLTTIELKSNFLSGVSSGELKAEASVFKKGRSLIVGDCLVTDDKGKQICRVSATFMLLKSKQKE